MSELHKFLFEGLPVRGMWVRLDDAWQGMLARRAQSGAYPARVTEVLGEMSAAAVLLQSNIQFDGALVLQISGDGPLKVAVAEVQSDLSLRATAKVVGEVAPGALLSQMVNVGGHGRCAITLDPKNRLPGQQPYQGVVPLVGAQGERLESLAQVLEHHMWQSEQLDTTLVLAANEQVAAGLLIQRMPLQGQANLAGSGVQRGDQDHLGQNEDYRRIALLAKSLQREELLTLDADTILRRLFWEEDLRRFEPASGEGGPRFVCNCSRQRVAGMLQNLGVAEVESIVSEQGQVQVGCEFCGAQYAFDAVQAAQVFVKAPMGAPGSERLQ